MQKEIDKKKYEALRRIERLFFPALLLGLVRQSKDGECKAEYELMNRICEKLFNQSPHKESDARRIEKICSGFVKLFNGDRPDPQKFNSSHMLSLIAFMYRGFRLDYKLDSIDAELSNFMNDIFFLYDTEGDKIQNQKQEKATVKRCIKGTEYLNEHELFLYVE